MARVVVARLLGVFFYFILISQAFASEITPSHVYQKTEVLRLSLQQLNFLDTQRYDAVRADRSLRHPRHVMQKVRECHTIVSKLLSQQNIDAQPLPEPFSLREVRPSDVKNGVDHLLQEVQSLEGGVVEVQQVALENGKVPSDVYNNLKRICAAIQVDTTPSDVYQIALAVNDNLDKIMRLRGYDLDVPYEDFEGKVPGDVYQETFSFLIDLRILALNSDFSIPGGVVVPNEVLQVNIVPQDVISLMNDALAETDAMKYTLGMREVTALADMQAKKKPSDVFSQIHRAHNVVRMLIEKEVVE